MRFRYDSTRSQFDAVTEIELGDLAHGYRAIDISGSSKELYSVACNLYLGIVLGSMPKKTKGVLAFTPKKKDGMPFASRADASASSAVWPIPAASEGHN